MKLSRIE